MPVKASKKKSAAKSATKSATAKPAPTKPGTTKSVKSAKPSKTSAAARKQALAPERIQAILDGLAAAYPNVECALHHHNA